MVERIKEELKKCECGVCGTEICTQEIPTTGPRAHQHLDSAFQFCLRLVWATYGLHYSCMHGAGAVTTCVSYFCARVLFFSPSPPIPQQCASVSGTACPV